MKWLPSDGMYLTQIRINERAGALTHDLAVDASGFGNPSASAAGLLPSQAFESARDLSPVVWAVLVAVVVLGAAFVVGRRPGAGTTA